MPKLLTWVAGPLPAGALNRAALEALEPARPETFGADETAAVRNLQEKLRGPAAWQNLMAFLEKEQSVTRDRAKAAVKSAPKAGKEFEAVWDEAVEPASEHRNAEIDLVRTKQANDPTELRERANAGSARRLAART